MTQPGSEIVVAQAQLVIPGVAWDHGQQRDVWRLVGDLTRIEPEEALAVMDTLANPPLRNVPPEQIPSNILARAAAATHVLLTGRS